MSSGFRVLAVVLGVVLTVALTPAVSTGDARRPRPDLKLTSGSVRLVEGDLRGSFVVKNTGTKNARGSVASLIVGPAGPGTGAVHVVRLRPGSKTTTAYDVPLPAGAPAGIQPVRICADGAGALRERSERNNCRQVGTVTVPVSAGPVSAGPVPAGPVSSVPTHPMSGYPRDEPFTVTSPASTNWVTVPPSYDASHATPMRLFVWLHGCSGFSAGDIYLVSPGGDAQHWISLTVGGEEGGCWDPAGDQQTVLTAIADLKTRFNIDPHRVVLGGYSSGGDLAYRMAFFHSTAFAGLLVTNTSPFKDTGASQADSLAAATTRFHIVHLAHLQDTTYPIGGVRAETDAVVSAGFPLTRIEVDGGHYDNPGATENGHPVPGTTADIISYLLPHLDDTWASP